MNYYAFGNHQKANAEGISSQFYISIELLTNMIVVCFVELARQ